MERTSPVRAREAERRFYRGHLANAPRQRLSVSSSNRRNPVSPARLVARVGVFSLALTAVPFSVFMLNPALAELYGDSTETETLAISPIMVPQFAAALAFFALAVWALVVSLSRRQPVSRSLSALAGALASFSLWGVLLCPEQCARPIEIGLPLALALALGLGLGVFARRTRASGT